MTRARRPQHWVQAHARMIAEALLIAVDRSDEDEFTPCRGKGSVSGSEAAYFLRLKSTETTFEPSSTGSATG
jgi:hypothetical protein